ncbi:hypothetical protein JCM5296_001789 [Sporobolomyces johnsonii]
MATTSDTRIGDSISPVLIPTSLAAAPSSDPAQPVGVPPATTAPPRAKAPIRTYGRRVVVEDSKDASGAEASNKALDRQSTTVVPETDFDAPVEDESHSWPKSGRSLKSGSSSPSRRSEHSTDPTTEEEAPAPKRSSMLNILDGLSSPAGSDDDDGDEEFGAVEFLKKKKTVAELLADIDREMDERDENALPAVAAAGSLSTSRDPFDAPSTKLPPTSSSLPPLTDSDIVSRHAGTSSSQQTPLAASRPSASARILDSPSEDDDDDSNAVPTARPKKASARVVHDSDDDDDEQVAPARPPATAKRSAVPDSSEHDDEASSPVRASSAAPTLSKQERVRALAAKKKAAAGSPPPARKAAPLFEESSDEDESKRRKKGKTAAEKKSKTKALSKKVEEEMNRTTAAFARGQEARLAPSIKTKLTVQDMLRNHGPRQPSVAPYPIPRPPTHPDIVTLTSSDPIVGTSSSPSSHCPAQPSSKALGKRRETSPIVEATPVPRRTLQIIRPPAWGKAAKTAEREQPAEEDDEELLPLAEMLEKRQKEKEKAEARRKEQAEKRRLRSEAIKAARAKALEDDDSDLDIEGAPAAMRTSTNKSKADPFRSAAATPRPPNELNHIMRDFAHVDPNHHPSDDEPTDSQFRAAGKEFGRNLDPKFRFVPSPANSKKKRSTSSAAPAPITLETLSHSLMSKTRQQNVQTRLKKVTKHQRQQNELAKPELGAVDVKAMMEKKKLEKDEDEQMDDAEDGDYYEEEEEEEAEATDSDLAAGSGSDVPVGRDGREGGEDKQEEDEGEVDSDGELVMPPSSQNSDRLGRAALAQDEDDEEEDEDAPVVRRNIGGKVRLADDDEDEEEGAQGDSATLPASEVATTAAAADAVEHAPARVALPGFLDAAGDGGFSQFFNSQFSQDAGAGNEVEGFGFRRAPEPSAFGPPAPTMLAPVPLISTAERAADAALLEARGGFHEVEPGTPREAVVPRQYINKQGFMTQTRPANLFADSPSDSPRDARSFASLSTSDSQSQLVTQTQFDVTQTPTQAARDKTNLRRLGALVGYESYSALAATEVQPDPTEVAMTDVQDGEAQEEESFPSAAQPTAAAKDAFSALREGARRSELAPIPEKSKARTEKNAFVDDQAGLSDEEGMGLGAPSGDEDEDGHDAELESLVDNEEVDRDVADEQDKLARERYAEDLEKQEQANLLRAQGIVAGKERQKRKGLDLDDDDFDDEYIGQRGHREKKVRVDTLTTAQLQANEETQAFAVQLTETYVVKPKDGDYNFLEESQEFSDAGDDDDDAGVARDVFAAEEEEDDDLQPLAVKMSVHDARAEMLRRQQELDEADDDRAEREPSLDIDIHLGNSSSPVAPLKLNNRIQAKKTVVVQSAQVDEYDDIDSQYSYFRQESHQAFVQYKASDSKDESQSGNGAPAGARSSVTSFKRSVPGAGKASSTSALGGKSARTGGPALAAKPSKLKGMRKGGFA